MQGEYRGDFTRDTFHRANHFCRVLMQQGRVQLDADWNEQTAILLHFLRSLARDIIGRHGGPNDAAGFNIQLQPGNSTDFAFGAGHYYVDGILCEFDAPAVPGTVMAASPPPTTPTQIQLTPSAVNGVGGGFLPQQTVELLNPATGESFGFVQVTSFDASSGTLTLAGTLPAANTPVSLRSTSSYLTQKNYPNPPALSIPCLVYLDVWERHLTSAQHNSIREVALGGPDTASRAEVIWQVKIENKTPNGVKVPPDSKLKISDPEWPAWTALWQSPNQAWLAAQVAPQPTSTDPCVIAPQSAYRGVENQLYRVEIHTGGGAIWSGATDKNGEPVNISGAVSFKFSRENGSVVFPMVSLAATPASGTTPAQVTVTLANLGRDSRLSLETNDWVEIADDASDLAASNQSNVPGPLLQVQSVDLAAKTVTLVGTTSITVDQPPTRHPLLRRWDHQQGDGKSDNLNIGSDGGALVQENIWLTLEDGIQVKFQSDQSSLSAAPTAQPFRYRSGNYWLIPARVATGKIEWPLQSDGKTAVARPPDGPGHYYAPVAFVTAAGVAINLRRSLPILAV